MYERWGRHRAALTATVIHFRARLALREAGKALGLSEEVTSVLAARGGGEVPDDEAVRALGLDPGAPRLRHALAVARTLVGFPRHLSQHPGGFVIGQGRLDEVVPVGPAAMPGRTMIEWDKDDLETLGILKVDVLGLGMLSCLRRGFDLLAAHHARRLDLAGVPPEDPAVYEMLCRADSLGVFQVESRAQMSFLPRMKPRTFYDLVIEVAIVRPGPIQGGMVHPYLRRRDGREEVRYPLPELEPVLGKTLGVPIFQEQAMRIAIIGAGFTPAEADGLRRAMATFRRVGTLPRFRRRFLERLVARGCTPEFAEQCWNQIEGFGEYGFPESHAASFAILVYASAWLKCHYPDVFACALLNSQPMGFYAPAQIVRDAREHGVEVRPVDVNASEWDSTLEPAAGGGGYALRLGFRLVKGLGEEAARRLAAARGNGYREAADVPGRTGLGERAMTALAAAAAFGSLDLGRREGWWAVERVKGRPLPLFAAAGEPERGPDPPVALPPAAPGEEIAADYRSVGLSLRGHPVALLRGGGGRGGHLERGAREGALRGPGRGDRGGAGPAAAEDREGGDLPHPRGHGRDRERRGVEPGLPALPARGAGRAPHAGRGAGRVLGVGGPRDRGAGRRSHAVARAPCGRRGGTGRCGRPRGGVGGLLAAERAGRPEPAPSPPRGPPPLPLARFPLSRSAHPPRPASRESGIGNRRRAERAASLERAPAALEDRLASDRPDRAAIEASINRCIEAGAGLRCPGRSGTRIRGGASAGVSRGGGGRGR